MYNSLAQLIFAVGVRFRNRRILDCLNSLRHSDSWSREQLLAHQNTELGRIVKQAAQTPFYQQRFEQAGIDPQSVESIADLRNLPVVSKLELVDNNASVQTAVPGQKNLASFTSGSSGLALIFQRNQDWDAWHNAAVMRGYGWHGVRMSDRKGYLWGYNLDPAQYRKARILDVLQNRFRMFSYSDSEMAVFCNKLRSATCLDGYSSMIFEVAKYIENHPELQSSIDLKLVKGTAEKILDVYQDKSLEVFGQRIVSEYGSAEAGIIAFECPQGKMHITMETVIVEKIDGRAIVTNLVSDSFPIIRYDIGDAVDIDFDETCSCGRASYIIKEVTGRVGKYIIGKHERYPSLTLYSLFKSMRVNYDFSCMFQGVQERAGHMTINLDRSLTNDERGKLLSEAAGYFGEDVELEIQENVNLVSGKSKMMDFISRIDSAA